jgi:(2Fe-2S) ferredoxin
MVGFTRHVFVCLNQRDPYRIRSVDDAREVVDRHVVGGEIVERLLMEAAAKALQADRQSPTMTYAGKEQR